MKLLLAAITIFILFTSTGYASSKTQRAHGAKIFTASGCMHCHSIRGSGGHKGPDLSGVGRRMNESRMQGQITNGSKQMPPFGDHLQSAEIKDLIAYLHSCKDKK
jgi:mono/diheme cytochrome c family protein